MWDSKNRGDSLIAMQNCGLCKSQPLTKATLIKEMKVAEFYFTESWLTWIELRPSSPDSHTEVLIPSISECDHFLEMGSLQM